MFHQCKSPITSYGVIAFRENQTQNNRREYLLIRRKDTLGFVDFMRGKYSIYNKEYILNMIKQMTNTEKSRLISEPFSKLWDDLWGVRISSVSNDEAQAKQQQPMQAKQQPPPIQATEPLMDYPTKQMRSAAVSRRDTPLRLDASHLSCTSSCGSPTLSQYEVPLCIRSGIVQSTSGQFLKREVTNAGESKYSRDPYKIEEQNSRNKFEALKSGVYTKTDSYNLEELIRMTEQKWTEPEWGFPKGRRNYQEKDYDCAVREFCEETGYTIDTLIPIKNIQPFEEIFTGSNYKSYKHKYYATYMKYEDTLSSRRFQVCEVSESAWMPFEQCDSVIRPYNVEKKRLLIAVDKMLSDNCLSEMYS